MAYLAYLDLPHRCDLELRLGRHGHCGSGRHRLQRCGRLRQRLASSAGHQGIEILHRLAVALDQLRDVGQFSRLRHRWRHVSPAAKGASHAQHGQARRQQACRAAAGCMTGCQLGCHDHRAQLRIPDEFVDTVHGGNSPDMTAGLAVLEVIPPSQGGGNYTGSEAQRTRSATRCTAPARVCTDSAISRPGPSRRRAAGSAAAIHRIPADSCRQSATDPTDRNPGPLI